MQQDAIDVAYPNTKGKLDPDLKAEDLNQPSPRLTLIREHGSSVCIDVLEVICAAISLIVTYSRVLRAAIFIRRVVVAFPIQTCNAMVTVLLKMDHDGEEPSATAS